MPTTDKTVCAWDPNQLVATLQIQMRIPPAQRDPRYLVVDPDYDQPLFDVVKCASDLGFCNNGKQLYDIPWNQIGTLSYVLINGANLNGGYFSQMLIQSSKLTNNTAEIDMDLNGCTMEDCDLSGTSLCSCSNDTPRRPETVVKLTNCKASGGQNGFQLLGTFSNSTLAFTEVDNAVISITLTHSQFSIDKGTSVDLSSSTFNNVTIAGSITASSFGQISNSLFQFCDLSSTSFKGSVTATQFPGTYLQGSVFENSVTSCNFEHAISSKSQPTRFNASLINSHFKDFECIQAIAPSNQTKNRLYSNTASRSMFAPPLPRASSSNSSQPDCPFGLESTSVSQGCLTFGPNTVGRGNTGLCAAGAGFIVPVIATITGIVLLTMLIYIAKKLYDKSHTVPEAARQEGQPLLVNADPENPESEQASCLSCFKR